MQSAESLTGAELIIRLLEAQGVGVIAGIPGGALLPLYEALGRSTKLRHILARHEQGAGFIAQGIARMTGKAGVCLATSGPGVTNVVTALADAKLDSVPLVCIAGQVPTHLIGTDAFQEVATIDMVRPITKACFFVRSAEELLTIIPEAFRLAEQGRPGSVLVDVPKDVQLQRVSLATSDVGRGASQSVTRGSGVGNRESGIRRETRDSRLGTGQTDGESASLTCSLQPTAYSLAAAPSQYDDALRYLRKSERPILYVGGGVTKARAHLLLREFAARADIPVVTTLMALGALPSSHPLNLGMLGMHGARFTNRAVDECDLLIAIGARFDDRATGDPQSFARHARVIHIDVDSREFGKIRQPMLAICDDARAALAKLNARTPPQRRDAWRKRIRWLRDAFPLHTPGEDRMCSPYGLIRAVSDCAPRDAIITSDVGQHQMWVAQAYPFQRPDRWLTSGGLGVMGFGLPAAIGAALAEPTATVLCFTGDGSLLMNVQELATVAELDLNVKIIVMDNAALGLVRQQQELFYGRRYVGSLYAQPSCFIRIANGFGVRAVDLGAAPAPHRALADALAEDGPMLIRAPIPAEHHVLPMVAPGAANIEAIV